MNSELRAKIKSILQTELSTCDSLYDDIADRILALLTPPATAKLPEGVRVEKSGSGFSVWIGEPTQARTGLCADEHSSRWVRGAARVFDTESDALTAALSAPPVPGDSNWIDTMSARIVELEAALKEKDKEIHTLRQNVWYGASDTPAEKPDARKVAPNGRAMARYELCGPNRESNMHGIDDEGHDWAWLHDPGEWIEPFPACMDSRRTLCTFDGTPITEPKPDPLARAVTVGDMLRLADNYDKRLSSLSTAMSASIRFIFAPQGAEHVE